MIMLMAALAGSPALAQDTPAPVVPAAPAAPVARPPTPAGVPGQPAMPAPVVPSGGSFEDRLRSVVARSTQPEPDPLVRFDLDFHGGTPKELIDAISKVREPVNAIIPEEYADTKLPALKLNNIDVAQLFEALTQASRSSEMLKTMSTIPGGGRYGVSGYQIGTRAFGFRTEGRPRDNSIWYFFVEKPAVANPPKICRFYPLARQVEGGLSVDDIITAIQTGWKMLGESNVPEISYHKDTKLLIAVGDPERLETIDSVLSALAPQNRPGMMAVDPVTGLPVPQQVHPAPARQPKPPGPVRN